MDGRRRNRVLYVEDDKCLREIVAALLAGDDLDVTPVGLVCDGLRELARREHDLVLADYHLPDGNGACMLHEARNLGLLRDVGAILLTSESRPVGVGDFEVLHKPVDCDELLSRVQGALAQRGRHGSGVRYRGPVGSDLESGVSAALRRLRHTG